VRVLVKEAIEVVHPLLIPILEEAVNPITCHEGVKLEGSDVGGGVP